MKSPQSWLNPNGSKPDAYVAVGGGCGSFAAPSFHPVKLEGQLSA
jgi:hypothetical protein